VLRAPEPPRVATGIHIAGRPSSISGDSSIPDRIDMLQLVRILSGIIARSSQERSCADNPFRPITTNSTQIADCVRIACS